MNTRRARLHFVLKLLAWAWFVQRGPALEATNSEVSFARDIAPLLQQKCVTCHGPEKTKGKYRLDSFQSLLKPGNSGETPLVADQPSRSKIFQLITANDPDERMPQKDDALPPEKIALIENWIAAGARFDGPDTNAFLISFAPRPPRPEPPTAYPRAVPVTALAFSPDGAELAASGYHEVTVWNATNGTLARRLKQMPQRIQSLAWHRDGRLLAVAGGAPGQSGELLLVDSRSGETTHTLVLTADLLLATSFSPDGARLASGGADNALRVFDLSTGAQSLLIQQHADWVLAVAWSPDGSRLASASRDRTARVYDGRTGELLASFTGHEAPATAVVFAPDGKSLISADRNKKLATWEIQEGKQLGEFGGSDGEISQLGIANGALFSCAMTDAIPPEKLMPIV